MPLLCSQFFQRFRQRQHLNKAAKQLGLLLCGLLSVFTIVLYGELGWSQATEVSAQPAGEEAREVVDLTVSVSHQSNFYFYLDYYPSEARWAEFPDAIPPDEVWDEEIMSESPLLPEAFKGDTKVTKLERTMRTVMGCKNGDLDTYFDYGFSLSGQCSALVPEGLQWNNSTDLTPLISLLNEGGIDELTVTLQLPEVGELSIVPAPERKSPDDLPEAFDSVWMDRFDSRDAFYDIDVAQPAITQLSYGYGFNLSQLVWRSLALALTLLVPLGLLVWLRQRVLRLHNHSHHPDQNTPENPPYNTLWFGYQRTIAWIELATWGTWVVVFFAVEASDWLPLLFPSKISSHAVFDAFSTLLFIVPPISMGLVSRLLSYRITKDIGQLDYTLPEIAIQYLATQAAILLPLSVLPATQLFYAGYGGLAKVLLVVMAVLFLLVTIAVRRLRDMTPYAITTGELRDRLFALAKPTGINLQNIYLLPMRRSRMVNAFAVKNDTVMVTDYLLKQMTKDEVDGIMAHELAHLQLGHPRKLTWKLIVTFIGLSFGLTLIAQMLSWLIPQLIVIQIPLTIGFGLYLFYGTSRKFEYQADAQAALITGNPQALMTGLVKVARFNQMPLQWGKLSESMMTHPSMQRRVMAIAQRHDIPTEEVNNLLNDPTDLTATEDGERQDYYDLDLLTTKDDGLPLFSSQFKQTTGARLGLLIVFGFALGTVVAGRLVQLLPTPGLQWLGYGCAAIALGWAYLTLLNIAPVWGYGKLAQQLGDRLQTQGIDTRQGQFVGFAPCDDESAVPKNYEGHNSWDVGFVFFKGNRLCYIGEQLKFALLPHQLARAVVKVENSSLVKSAAVALTWQDDELASHTFTLQPLSAASVAQTRPLSQSLQDEIETWQTQATEADDIESAEAASETLFEALERPVLGEVTSQPMPAFSLKFALNTWCFFLVIFGAIALLTNSLFISTPLTSFILLMATAYAWSQCLPAFRRTRKSASTS